MDVREEADLLLNQAGVRILDEVVVAAVGEDTREWLHGQLTVDLREPASAVRYGLVLSVQGKVLGDVRVIERGAAGDGERFDLLLPGAHADAILERLERFLVMEDVELERLPLRVVSVQGPGSAAAVAAHPEVLAVDRLGHGGHDLLVPEEDAEKVAASLGVPQVGEAGWELARLRSGQPRMGVDFGGNTLPQEAGLEKRALSFDQGCYVGQEPVIMLQHRGKPPKRLVRLTFAGPAPAPGTPVRAGNRDVGTLTSVADDGAEAIAMALVKRKALEGDAPLEVDERPVTVALV